MIGDDARGLYYPLKYAAEQGRFLSGVSNLLDAPEFESELIALWNRFEHERLKEAQG